MSDPSKALEEPWAVGRLLPTFQTRRMDAATRRRYEEDETRCVFARFTLADEGKGRILIGKFQSPALAARVVELHNAAIKPREETA